MATNVELLAEAVMVIGGNEHAESIVEAWENGELLTFAEWKKRGYSVVKGQKSVFSCDLWKKVTKKDKEEADKEAEKEATTDGEKPKKYSNFVKKKCCFFLPSQVEKIVVAKVS